MRFLLHVQWFLSFLAKLASAVSIRSQKALEGLQKLNAAWIRGHRDFALNTNAFLCFQKHEIHVFLILLTKRYHLCFKKVVRIDFYRIQ